MSNPTPTLIGIDGGGSTCRAALRAGARRIDRQGGPSNVTTDFDSAIRTIAALIKAVLAEAGREGTDGLTCHLGLAGVTGPAIAARVEAALSAAFPGARFRATGDQVTTLAGALGTGPGAVAGIGTGSFVARTGPQGFRSLGGRGLVLGDQASGAWLGLRLLQEIMLAVDGLRGQSALGQAIMARHGDDPGEIIAFARTARPSDFATLAPELVAAAGVGDTIARELMAEGAAWLTAALAAIGWSSPEPLCLTGGLGPAYAPYLPAGHQALLIAPQGSALDGALALAERAAP